VLQLALDYGEEPTTIHALAKRIDAPVKFLEQIVLELKKGGFVESRRGKDGGYFLARPPKTIIVGDVIRHIEGPTEPIACVCDKYKKCVDMDTCVFRPLWQKINQTTVNIIDTVTFEELITQVQTGQHALTYSI